MSDPTDNGRDDTGRFVKRAAESVHKLNTPSEEGIHPLSQILFGWTHTKGIGNIIFWGLLALSAIMLSIDFFFPRHDYLKFSNYAGFYGIWGFVCFSFAVIMGWPLGHLLRRDENYYGDAGGPPHGVDPDAPMADEATVPHHSSEGDA